MVVSSPAKNMPGNKVNKKAKKRSIDSGDQDESKDSKPKKKVQKHSFTEIEFNVGLRDPNTIFKALDDFVTTASEYPETTDFDIVGSYCRSSGECIEIFKLLEGSERRKPAELSRIFEVLEIILINIAGRLPKLKPVGKAVVRRILAGHIGTIIFCLNGRNKSGQIKSALKLLSAMVLQGDNAPRDILAQVDLQNAAWPPLLNRRDILDPMDVRGCMLHFMLSFLMVGEKDTIRAVLEVKGFLNGLFPGLIADKLTTLQMVLPALKEKVVENSDISKTLKVRLLSDRSLSELVKLYRWKGPQKYTGERRKSRGEEEDMVIDVGDEGQGEALNDPQSEDRSAIAEMVHKLLLEICCDFKLGINFFDKSFGTSGKNQNHVLTTFLSAFKQPHLSSRLSELVVEVLKACPDQLMWYLPALKFSLTPRVSNKWVAAMTLLHKVYEAQPEVAPCMKQNERIPIAKLVAMARSCIIPPREIWTHIVTAIRHKSPVVQHEGLLIFHLVLKRAKATLDFCSQKKQLYSQEELEAFITEFKNTITKTCPDIPTLMQCWSRAVRSTDGKLSEKKAEGEGEEDDKSDEDMDVDDIVAKGFPEVSQADHLLRVLQALCEYQAVLPKVFADHSVNFGLLLEGVRATANDDSASTHQVSLLQIHLLRLLAESKVKQITWLKESFSGRSTLYLLLEMIIITHSDVKMLPITINLLQKLFVSTGLFDNTESEVKVWLEHISMAAVDGSQTEVLAFAEKVFSAVLKDPFTYTERVAVAVSDNLTLEEGDATETGSTATTSDHLIDMVLSMDEVDLKKEGESTHFPPTHGSIVRNPFSILIPSALSLWTEEYKVKDESTCTGVKEYLGGVMNSILHSQVDPVPLCVLLHHHKATSLHPLAKRWLPNKKGIVTPKKVKRSMSDESSLSGLLMSTFSGPVTQLLSPDKQSELVDECRAVDLDLSKRTITQLLLYMRTCAREAGQDDAILEATDFYLKLISTVTQSLSSSEVERAPESVPDDLQKEDLHLGSLKVNKASACDVLQRVYSIIVRHPDLEEWFLWERPQSARAKEIKIGAKLRTIVTENMASILNSVPLDIAPKLTNDLIKYRQKTREQFTVYVKRLRSGKIDCEEDYEEVLEAMSAMLKFTPWEEVIEDVWEVAQIPAEALVHKKKLTVQGRLLLTFIKHILAFMKTEGSRARNVLSNLPLDSVSVMFTLVTDHSLPELDTALLDLLQACPLYAMAANNKHFLRCLEPPSNGVGLKLAEMLVAHSEACSQWFASWWAGLDKDERKDGKWSHLPIVYQYALRLCPGEKPVCKKLRGIHAIYWSDLVAWIQTNIEKDGEETKVRLDMLRYLTATCKTLEVLQTSWEELLVFLTGSTQLTSSQAEYVHHITECVARLDVDETLPVWDVYVSTCLACASNLLTAKGAKANRPTVYVILASALKVLKNRKGEDQTLAEVVQPIWNQLIKAGLRNLYTNVSMLLILKHLVGVVYSCQSDVIPAHTVYEMLMSHSQFLSSMLETSDLLHKDALVDLMLTLARKDSAKCCMKSAHITVLLGAYGATLHKTDQKILLLVALYEANGCSLNEHRPLLWGPKAVEHHSIKKSLGASLWKRASTDQVLEILDTSKLALSCLHFPLQRKLSSENVVEPESVSSMADVYDPTFILPLFSQLLGPGMIVHCFQFVESGSLSYVFCALSSHDPAMRGAAYHVLAEFYRHVEGLRFPGKDQVFYLLKTVRYSITEPNLKLASIVTTFLARAAKLMVNPEAALYSSVNEFMLLKPSIDVLNVPEFYKLFNSSTLEYKTERSWMLSLLGDGLRETADYRLFEKRYIFKLILSFHDSPLSDERTRVLVLKVLLRAVKHRTIAVDLVKHDAILVWINGVITSSASCQEKEELIVDILDSLWRTMSVARVNDQGHVKVASVPLGFTNEILHILLHLLHSLRGVEDMRVISKFILLLNSVLSHLRTTLTSMAGHDPISVSLKVADTLELLRLWSSAIHDHRAVHDLDLISGPSEKGTKEARTNVKKKLHKKTNLENEEKQEISEEDRKIMERASVHNILEIMTHWKPSRTNIASTFPKKSEASTSETEVSSLMFVMDWCVGKMFGSFPDDLELLSSVLCWIQGWVLNENTQVLRSILVSDKPSARQFISNMLSIYGHCTQALLDQSGCLSTSIVDKLRVISGIKACVTQILAALIDHALQHGGESGSMLLRRLELPHYREAMELLPKIKHSQSTVCLLIQELWLKASKSGQFILTARRLIKDAGFSNIHPRD